jgi:hypothetical protein
VINGKNMLATKELIFNHLLFLRDRVKERVKNHINNEDCNLRTLEEEIERINFFDKIKENYR